MKSGLLPVLCTAAPPSSHATSTLRADLGIHRCRAVKCAAGDDDVDARGKQLAQLVEVERARHVEHTVGAELDDLVDGCRGGYLGGFRAAQLAGVAAHLVIPADVDTGECHARMFDDRPQRAGADSPRRPLDASVFASLL